MHFILQGVEGTNPESTAALKSSSHALYWAVERCATLVEGDRWIPRYWRRHDPQTNTAVKLERCAQEGDRFVVAGPGSAVSLMELQEFVSGLPPDAVIDGIKIHINDGDIPLSQNVNVRAKSLSLTTTGNGLRVLVSSAALLDVSSARDVEFQLEDANVNDLMYLPRDFPVTSLSLDRGNIDIAALQYMASMRSLRTLDMEGLTYWMGMYGSLRAEHGDEFCRCISQLHALESLKVAFGSWVSDVGMGHLGTMRALTSLAIRGTKITDDGVRGMMAIHVLRDLLLGPVPRVTDEGLRWVGAHGGLTSLIMWFLPAVTDEGVGHLTGLRALTSLTLGMLRGVTDVGLASVGTMVSLKRLRVSNVSRVTTEGFRPIASLPLLSTLSMDGMSQISDEIRTFVPSHVQLQR